MEESVDKSLYLSGIYIEFLFENLYCCPGPGLPGQLYIKNAVKLIQEGSVLFTSINREFRTVTKTMGTLSINEREVNKFCPVITDRALGVWNIVGILSYCNPTFPNFHPVSMTGQLDIYKHGLVKFSVLETN